MNWLKNLKTWHVLVGWAVLFGLSIPPARMVRHMNQPPIEVRYDVPNVTRAYVYSDHLDLIHQTGNGKSKERESYVCGGGTITVVEDAATDAEIRLEVVSLHGPSMFKDTERTDPIRRDLILHVNPKGKVKPDHWVTEAGVLKRQSEEVERREIVARRANEIRLVREAALIQERWEAEDKNRDDYSALKKEMSKSISTVVLTRGAP